MIEVDFFKAYPQMSIEAKFTFERGFNFIVGPSGCGKSTTLSVVAGLIKPERGLVRCCEEVFLDTDKGIFLPPQKRRIGVVFQEHTLMPHLTVEGNIRFALGKVKDRKIDADEIVDRFGLRGLENRYPHELSGGQKQRVAVLMALAFEPRALLMDEPFSSLDFDTKMEIMEFLKSLHADIPIVIVSHDPLEAITLADRVYVMREGKVVASGGKDILRDLLRDSYRKFVEAFEGLSHK